MSYDHYMRVIGTDKAAGDALLIPIVGNPDCTEELTTELRKVSNGSRAWFAAYPLNGDEHSRALSVSHPSLTIEICERDSVVGTDLEWLASKGYAIAEAS